MKIDLKNKVVLITGATGGIGAAMVHAFSQTQATLAIHYLSNKSKAVDLAVNSGNNSKTFMANLSSPDEAQNLFNEVVKHYEGIDVIINNAGIYTHSPISSDEWYEQWLHTMNTNLNTTGLLCKLAIAHFLEKGGGRIINIASRAAFRGDTGDYLAYAASKGGLVSLTKTIARSFGKNNIIAFSIAPGFVRTQMAKEFIEKNGEQQILNEISLPELTEAEDLAPTAVFLASGMMDHATGSTIDINAGSYMR